MRVSTFKIFAAATVLTTVGLIWRAHKDSRATKERCVPGLS